MSVKVLIIHGIFDALGGGELFVLKLAKALIEEGFQVDILTSTYPNIEKIRDIYGETFYPRFIVKRVRRAEYLNKLMPGRLVRLRRLIIYNSYNSLIEEARKEYDLVLDTQSNLPTPVDVSYIHYPALLPTQRKEPLYNIYNSIVSFIARSYKKPRSARILTNSTWTAHVIYRLYGIIPDVLYPPVDIDYFVDASISSDREKIIVTISRFSPEKRLDKLFEVAKQLPSYTFILVGSTGPGSDEVLNNLKTKKDTLGIHNVEFKPNLPRSQLKELLGKALFYLHPEFTEHFGIAIIEAMSAGCIPIVYRDGGAWYDAVSKISDKLGYTDISEVPRIISNIEKEKELQKELREKSIEVSKQFSYEKFKKSLTEKIYFILKVKKLS